jgi:hypothetical protein
MLLDKIGEGNNSKSLEKTYYITVLLVCKSNQIDMANDLIEHLNQKNLGKNPSIKVLQIFKTVLGNNESTNPTVPEIHVNTTHYVTVMLNPIEDEMVESFGNLIQTLVFMLKHLNIKSRYLEVPLPAKKIIDFTVPAQTLAISAICMSTILYQINLQDIIQTNIVYKVISSIIKSVTEQESIDY